jgi:hypothetical protein
VSIPSLIAVVVAAVLAGLMLVLIMPVDLYSPTFGEGEFSEVHLYRYARGTKVKNT